MIQRAKVLLAELTTKNATPAHLSGPGPSRLHH